MKLSTHDGHAMTKNYSNHLLYSAQQIWVCFTITSWHLTLLSKNKLQFASLRIHLWIFGFFHYYNLEKTSQKAALQASYRKFQQKASLKTIVSPKKRGAKKRYSPGGMSYNSSICLEGTVSFWTAVALLLWEVSLLLALLLALPFSWLVGGGESSAALSALSEAATRDNQTTLKARVKKAQITHAVMFR